MINKSISKRRPFLNKNFLKKNELLNLPVREIWGLISLELWYQQYFDNFTKIKKKLQFMKILILGGDGYLGWPTAMYLSNRGYEVLIVDDYSRKKIANDTNSQALIEGENMYERCEIFHHYYGKRIKF